MPVETQAPRHFLDDPPVLACVTGQRQHRLRELNETVGVGEAAGLLVEAGCRQYDVGQHRGLGQEDVLHHEVLQLRQPCPRVVEIGVGHRRVLALDVHGADAALAGSVHDLDHGQARGVRQRSLPQRLEARPHPRLGHALVVRQHHRDQAGVRRALDVVLPAQRCRPVPGRPIWPVISASAIRQRELSVPWVCCDTPMPQKMMLLGPRA